MQGTPEVRYQRGAEMPYGAATQANANTPGMAEIEAAAQEFLVAPTDQPDVPFTNGLPFGEGATYIQHGREDEKSMRQRVANSLEASPSADPFVRRLAERIRRGE